MPDEMVETLVARADGIPLYVEELTKAVVEPGVARSMEAIPPTLADSLMARLDRLSAAKEVAQRAAVLGREFSYTLLLALAEMPEAVLRNGLARLVDAKILYVRGQPPDAVYTFNHALVQEAAYGSLLKRTRQHLHGDVVGILLERFPERAAAEPEVVARHADLAGRIDDAIIYHGLAGEHALARSAHEEAIGQFRRAIALLDTGEREVEQHARELPLQIALGTSLIAVRGYSHAETETAFERAAELAARANAATQLGMARIGLAILYANRAELERGRTLLADVLAAAEARGDQHQAMMCYANLAPMEHYQGKLESSLACCERAIALYDAAQYVGKPRVPGAEEGVVALGVAGWNLWQLGYPDAALARAQAAVALARRLERPFPLAFALFFEVVVHWNRGRQGAALQERVAEVVALSEAQGFRLWRGIGGVFRAAVRVTDADTGLAEIMENLTLAGETGNQAGAPALMLVLAETQRTAGQLDAARGTVAAALAFAAQTGQPFWDADLHRLDGDLLLATGCAADEAISCYHRALAIAREQGARSLELRAATSLARLWRDQGKRAEARELLAPIYGWFSEGFDTRDLIDAKALLDEQ
jgi:tetratricopeptide (TPR) repeat protein